jgi:hypothetical protein
VPLTGYGVDSIVIVSGHSDDALDQGVPLFSGRRSLVVMMGLKRIERLVKVRDFFFLFPTPFPFCMSSFISCMACGVALWCCCFFFRFCRSWRGRGMARVLR